MKTSARATDEQLDEIVGSIQQLLREHQRWLLLIGTGASMAISPEMGMIALRKHLLDDGDLNSLDGWAVIADRLTTAPDLEQALTGITLSTDIVAGISRSTGNFVAERDLQHRDQLLNDPASLWPCTNLLRHLVNRLPRNAPRQAIVTPNYDMFIEYVCSGLGIRYTTGYVGGVIRHGDWSSSRDGLFRTDQIIERGRRRGVRVPVSAVELMKVHGSINLFRTPNSSLVESDVWVREPPPYHERVLAPPGDAKNAVVVNNRDWFSEADPALQSASAFLVIGYGFNDPHIHRIVERRAEAGAPVIVLTQDPTETLDALAERGEQVWVLTAEGDGSAPPDSTCARVVTRAFTEPLRVSHPLWSAETFANYTMGD